MKEYAMDWHARIKDVQKQLVKEKIDGWLLYDFHGINALAREFLKLDPKLMVTRRFFYWIPSDGEPIKILHIIEPHLLSHLPGKTKIYLKWQEMEAQLDEILKKAKTIAMEYSPRNAIPYLSKVDAGIIDLVRSLHVEVISSASFLQNYTCVLDEEQLKSHLEAAEFLDNLAGKTWEKISQALRSDTKIDEYQVRMFIVEQMQAHDFMTEGLPICGVNAHSADPHFEPLKEGSSEIKRGDVVLIDLWCKKKHPRAIYADITRVAIADSLPTERQLEIFSTVRAAQKSAIDYVISRYAKGESLKGYEVDQVCRKVIEDKGYGRYFTHRSGHNIYTQDHGPGAHIDSLETLDLRELIPHTCFSIEPGIYLPGEFGIRLECDIYLGDKRKAHVTGGIEDKLLCLLG
jgi:Xaa-Pro dipeptidase